MAFEISDPRYPKEIQCEDRLDPRTWICTAKKATEPAPPREAESNEIMMVDVKAELSE
jgi:hypothetical protein